MTNLSDPAAVVSVNEAGGITTLPQNSLYIISNPTERKPMSLVEESTTPDGRRKRVTIDLLKLARAMEQVSGEQIVSEEIV